MTFSLPHGAINSVLCPSDFSLTNNVIEHRIFFLMRKPSIITKTTCSRQLLIEISNKVNSVKQVHGKTQYWLPWTFLNHVLHLTWLQVSIVFYHFYQEYKWLNTCSEINNKAQMIGNIFISLFINMKWYISTIHFADTTVLLCDFHRDRAWQRWLNSSDIPNKSDIVKQYVQLLYRIPSQEDCI